MSPGVFLYFLKKYDIVNIKILTFFIGPFQQFFFQHVFFINKCQTEILTCVPPSPHVCDFFFKEQLQVRLLFNLCKDRIIADVQW